MRIAAHVLRNKFVACSSREPCWHAADGSVPVNVNLVRNGGDYVEPPKPAYTAFSGQGRTLAGE